MFPDLGVHRGLVAFGRELEEEVACVDGEERREERGVGDVDGVNGVAVASGASVHADVGAFRWGEAGEDADRWSAEA